MILGVLGIRGDYTLNLYANFLKLEWHNQIFGRYSWFLISCQYISLSQILVILSKRFCWTTLNKGYLTALEFLLIETKSLIVMIFVFNYYMIENLTILAAVFSPTQITTTRNSLTNYVCDGQHRRSRNTCARAIYAYLKWVSCTRENNQRSIID